MQDFMQDVAPAVRQVAAQCGLDNDQADDVLSVAWLLWRRCAKQLPPWHWGWLAVRKARSRRPCVGVPNQYSNRDALNHRGGGEWVVETFPAPTATPDRVAAARELVELVGADLGGTAARFFRLASTDWSAGTLDLARDVGVTPSRVSQLRRELLAKAQALSE